MAYTKLLVANIIGNNETEYKANWSLVLLLGLTEFECPSFVDF